MTGPAKPQAPRNMIVRDASAFLWAVLEQPGAASLGAAALALCPGEMAVPKREDILRHMLFVAVAVLCEAASVRLFGEPAAAAAALAVEPRDIVQSAERAIAAIERASVQELAEAHAYFLAPCWSGALVDERRSLAELCFGVARFMIDCARQCADEQGCPSPEQARPE